ncbi:proline dehydrogenase family protein [Actinomadura rupiterrae]|uniref:proline dehydrogenase family protein n=1 Tax=Actinomadura rupiterrae TaxID=559627 RepID=UPI0020A342FA|nr:proline dehydrogenase family protein [Actinomadura rupiterrae]MCP2343502.1 proline dehydrogenase [Actinomadura rupiterrae]
MLRHALLAASHSRAARKVVRSAPGTRGLVRRFVAGETIDDALLATRDIAGQGLLVSLDALGEDTLDSDQAAANVDHYAELLGRLGTGGLADRAEVSLKLSAVGQALDEDLALENARRVCAAAKEANTTVTLDMEQYETVDSTLRVVAELRREYPETGVAIQSYLRRSEEYCAELAHSGSRVRLCKGAYSAPESVAFTSGVEIDKSFVRCMRVLMAGQGYPMIATHDPRLIEIGGALASLHDRDPSGYEYQMLYGIRPQEQRRLAGEGARVRVYVAFGREWYGYFMRRLAEKPSHLGFLFRSIATKS